MRGITDAIPDTWSPAFPKRSQYKEVLSHAIGKAVESGVMNGIFRRWNVTGVKKDISGAILKRC